MQEFPHHYQVTVNAQVDGNLTTGSSGIPDLEVAPPAEFGGPGDQWSPETLLVAAVADCFVLSFRAVARASRFDWIGIECSTEGTLDRVERVTQFIRYVTRVKLSVPAGTDSEKAMKLLHKSEQVCLITNSLKGESELIAELVEV